MSRVFNPSVLLRFAAEPFRYNNGYDIRYYCTRKYHLNESLHRQIIEQYAHFSLPVRVQNATTLDTLFEKKNCKVRFTPSYYEKNPSWKEKLYDWVACLFLIKKFWVCIFYLQVAFQSCRDTSIDADCHLRHRILRKSVRSQFVLANHPKNHHKCGESYYRCIKTKSDQLRGDRGSHYTTTLTGLRCGQRSC